MIYTLTLNPAIDRELLVPAFTFGEVLRASAQRVDAGGKGFNVSRALRALGVESVALGFVGGHAGQMIAELLSRLSIAADFVPIAGGETRTNVTVLAEGRHLKVNESGPSITRGEEGELLDKIRRLARKGDLWVLSGSLPPGASPGIYAEIVGMVEGAGGRALLDTSGPALAAGCSAGPFLVKPNAAEASELTGLLVRTFGEGEAAAGAIRRMGVGRVLISLGRQGALLSEQGRVLRATPPPIVERNPIGAGDALLAGLVWGLSRELPLPEAFRLAVACGAGAASLPGTSFAGPALVAELARQVSFSDPGS
ncbi:MAG TPA: 1-phosphofructokinase [Anaeromyxobacter sp.]|nr:1-phosphofructokinase [Anaeromyxobacter sp.]